MTEFIAAIVGLLVVFVFYVWIPMKMAEHRNRNVLVWVLISIFASPIIAILLLVALGEARTGGPAGHRDCKTKDQLN